MFTKRFFISQCILPLPTTINICTLFYPRIIFFTFCRMKKLWCKHSSTEIPMINTKICAKNKVFNKSNLSINITKKLLGNIFILRCLIHKCNRVPHTAIRYRRDSISESIVAILIINRSSRINIISV